MNRWKYFAICAVFHCIVSCTSSPSTIDGLKSAIQLHLSQQKGTFAVAYKDLNSENELFIDEHEQFHAASTMKTPVMVELYKQAATGLYSLGDSILLNNQFKSIADSSVFSLNPDDDSETELYKHPGEKRSMHQLIDLMITKSSNYSTNLLIERAGAARVTQTMRELGAKDIQVLRGVEDNKAYERGMNNLVTAYDLMLIFEKLAKGTLVNDSASKDMIRVLLAQTFNEIIPAQLPKDVKIAHKTGWFKTVNHDGGIVFLPDGRKYVLVLLSKNVAVDAEAVKALADVSRMIYDYEMHIKQ